MELNGHQKQEVIQMLSEGYQVNEVRVHLGLPDTDEGWQAVRQVGTSWQGTKQSISLMLTNLANEPDADKRQDLRITVEERIDRLYEQAHGVASRMRSVRRALDG